METTEQLQKGFTKINNLTIFVNYSFGEAIEVYLNQFETKSTTTSEEVDQFKCSTSANQDNSPHFSLLFLILFGIPASVIILITILGNLMVLCFKARVGKRQTTLLIWNLGLADFLVGVVVLPIGVAYIINGQRWPFGRLMCRLWTACDVIFCTASIVTLCVISIDRYIGVTKPLRYKQIVTKRRVIVAIVTIWLFSILILLCTVRYSSQDQVHCPTSVEKCHVSEELEYVVHSVVTAFFLPASVTLALYWKIYSVAKKRENNLQQGLLIALGDNFLSACLSDSMRVHCGKDSVKEQRKVIRMHKRVAKTLGVVVCAFLVCWLPFFTVYLINYHCRCIPDIALDVLSWIGYINSMLNPVIYAFTVEEFKETLRQIKMHGIHTASTVRRKISYRFELTQSQRVPRNRRAYSVNCDGSLAVNRGNLKYVERQHNPTGSPSPLLRSNVDEELFQQREQRNWNAKLYCILVDDQNTIL